MGTILKYNVVESLKPKITKFNFCDVRAEAAGIIQRACDQLDRAKAEAKEIIEQARKEAEEIRQSVRAEGFQEGFNQGLAEGKKEGTDQAFAQAQKDFAAQNQQIRTMLENLLRTFEDERDHLITQSHQDLLALALAIAGKITHEQIKIDPQIVLENVRSAVKLVASRSAVQVRMNPSDIDRFGLIDPEEAEKLLHLKHVRIVKDPSVEEGGCVVATDHGTIDGQVTTQIDNMIRQLSPAMEETIKKWSGDSV